MKTRLIETSRYEMWLLNSGRFVYREVVKTLSHFTHVFTHKVVISVYLSTSAKSLSSLSMIDLLL